MTQAHESMHDQTTGQDTTRHDAYMERNGSNYSLIEKMTSKDIRREMVYELLDPIRVPVTINGRKYMLCEADEAVACRWRNEQLRNTKINSATKAVTVEGMADTEPFLVHLCLFQCDDEGKLRTKDDGSPDPRYVVPLPVIRKWPPHLVKDLFERAKQISRLTDDEKPKSLEELDAEIADLQQKRDALLRGVVSDEESKNSPGATTGTSV
jgi:hypothetical protein